ILDTSEAPRFTFVANSPDPHEMPLRDSLLTVCPGGDGYALKMQMFLGGVCNVRTEDKTIPVIAVRKPTSTASSARLWSLKTNGWSDTLWASYTVSNHLAQWFVPQISGSGRIMLDIYADGVRVARDVTLRVRSYDVDSKSIGSVDRFDVDRTTYDRFHPGS